MKKIIVLSIIFLHLFYAAGAGFAAGGNSTAYSPTIKTYGLSSLFIIVYDNTLAALNILTELSGITPSLPSPQKENQKPKNKNNSKEIGVISSYKLNTLVRLACASGLGTCCNYNNFYINCLKVFALLFLLFGIFLLLHRIKLFYLNARSSISDNSNRLFALGGFNPNLECIRIRVFYVITREKL